VPRVYLQLHYDGDLRNSTVADRLSMFTTCGRFPWKAATNISRSSTLVRLRMEGMGRIYIPSSEPVS
jgi:hypothetical protein